MSKHSFRLRHAKLHVVISLYFMRVTLHSQEIYYFINCKLYSNKDQLSFCASITHISTDEDGVKETANENSSLKYFAFDFEFIATFMSVNGHLSLILLI